MKRNYEPHLSIREFSVPPGGEWLPESPCWSLIQVGRGTGYFLQSASRQELEIGTVLMIANHQHGSIRASQLGGLVLFAFNIIPGRLTSLVTLEERDFLELAASRKDFPPRIFPPGNPVAVKMKELCADRNQAGLLFRLNLLRLFVEVFSGELQQATSHWETTDARERLRLLLQRTPMAELLEINFDELARMTHCTSRHLGRIFHDVVGMSFREKRTEIRLARARELLATSKTKVVEVALESGYKSLSLFNLMFTRRFGTSPARWRQKYADSNKGDFENIQNPRRDNLRPAEKSMLVFQMNPPKTLVGGKKATTSVSV
ncbi:MAG: helix-turn-helix domain-containing protein [Limisphaerales bacterium]